MPSSSLICSPLIRSWCWVQRLVSALRFSPFLCLTFITNLLHIQKFLKVQLCSIQELNRCTKVFSPTFSQRALISCLSLLFQALGEMWETFITSSLWLREAVWNTALATITRTITMWKCCQSRRLLKLAERETEETDTGRTSQPSVNCSQSGEAERWSSKWESHRTLLLRTKQHCKGRTSGQTPRLYLGTSTTRPVLCTHLYQIRFAK